MLINELSGRDQRYWLHQNIVVFTSPALGLILRLKGNLISILIVFKFPNIPDRTFLEAGDAISMDSCLALTSCRKLRTQPGSLGTPWSGHALKWK